MGRNECCADPRPRTKPVLENAPPSAQTPVPMPTSVPYMSPPTLPQTMAATTPAALPPTVYYMEPQNFPGGYASTASTLPLPSYSTLPTQPMMAQPTRPLHSTGPQPL